MRYLGQTHVYYYKIEDDSVLEKSHRIEFERKKEVLLFTRGYESNHDRETLVHANHVY